jgi:hypothetical protein
VLILLFMPYFLFMNRIGMSVVLRYLSMVDMVKVADCCDPSSVGILTCVNSLEYIC